MTGSKEIQGRPVGFEVRQEFFPEATQRLNKTHRGKAMASPQSTRPALLRLFHSSRVVGSSSPLLSCNSSLLGNMVVTLFQASYCSVVLVLTSSSSVEPSRSLKTAIHQAIKIFLWLQSNT
ncbi:MAG: hypothetical protein VW834_05615 [Synechococcus sp.]